MDSPAPGVFNLLPPSQILPAPRRSRKESHSRVLRLLINAFTEWLAGPNSTKQSQRSQFWKRTLHPEFVAPSAAQEHNTHSETRVQEHRDGNLPYKHHLLKLIFQSLHFSLQFSWQQALITARLEEIIKEKVKVLVSHQDSKVHSVVTIRGRVGDETSTQLTMAKVKHCLSKPTGRVSSTASFQSGTTTKGKKIAFAAPCLQCSL